MTITAVKKVNQYLEVTEDGKTKRYSVDWADCIVSAIMTGILKVVNIYRGADSKFYAVYIDANGVQQTAELGASGAGLGDMLKSVYDTDADGVVDTAALATYASNSDKLDGHHWSEITGLGTILLDCGTPTSFVHNGVTPGEIAMIEFDGGTP